MRCDACDEYVHDDERVYHCISCNRNLNPICQFCNLTTYHYPTYMHTQWDCEKCLTTFTQANTKSPIHRVTLRMDLPYKHYARRYFIHLYPLDNSTTIAYQGLGTDAYQDAGRLTELDYLMDVTPKTMEEKLQRILDLKAFY